MKKTFDIYGMHCAGCANSVQKALSSVEGVRSVSVQLAMEKAVVEFEDEVEKLPIDELTRAVSGAGFKFHQADEGSQEGIPPSF